MSAGRVGRQMVRIAAKNDDDVVECGTQQAGQHEAVAAVVARPCEHDDGSGALFDQAERDVRRRSAGPLHQILAREPGLQASELGGTVDRRKLWIVRGHGGIIGSGVAGPRPRHRIGRLAR